MNYQIIGDSDCPLVDIKLANGENVYIERGSMAYMSNVELEGKMNSNKSGLGGLLSAIGRSIVSGESMFITKAKGLSDNARLGIAPSIPGKIMPLEVGYKQYRLNTGAFLACDSTVTYNIVSQSAGKALLGGTGGFFIMETSGEGDVLVNAFGDIIELTVTPENPLTIDNEHVVAWDADLDYQIEVASGTFGFTTGEGFVNKFSGSGKVLIQTRNVHSLAEEIRKFIPTQSNNSN